MKFQYTQRYRIFILAGIIAAGYCAMMLKLAVIQLNDNPEYSRTIDTQSIRIVRIPAVRGRILSSDKVPLADNKPVYDIVFHIAEMRLTGLRDKTVNYVYFCADKLSKLIKKPMEITPDDIIEHMNMAPAMPLTVFTDLTQKQLAIASEILPPVPGMEITAESARLYKYGKEAAHVIGYTGKDDPGTAPDRTDYSYYIPDIEGKAGLEKMLDQSIIINGNSYGGLRGKAGTNLLRVNAKGFVHDDLGVTSLPVDGNDVVLTINQRAQLAAEKVLEGKKGALVVVDADTGAVLAMASSPSYNLNDFTNGMPASEWKTMTSNPDRPLLNRALLGVFMPGSIMKPLVALAALKAGIDPEAQIFCDGAAKIGNSAIRCWAVQYGGHGYEDMIDGLKDSCNVYFVQTGIKVGFDRLVEMFQAAGIGTKTGIGLPESNGILPAKELKKDEKWTTFDTGLISIGQGMVAITPIQAAMYTAAIANGGTLWKPYLVKAVYNCHHKLLSETIPQKVRKLPVSKDAINTVQFGMYMVVHDENGSGKRANTDVMDFYGKTGTAQVGFQAIKTKDTWFIGFGKYGNETIALALTIQGGEAGGLENAPLVKKFLELWLEHPYVDPDTQTDTAQTETQPDAPHPDPE